MLEVTSTRMSSNPKPESVQAPLADDEPVSLPAAAVQRRIVTLPPLVRALRPLQWTKNAIVFAALVFDRRVFEPARLIESIAAFIIFCAISSAIYLINDVRDVESDRNHPKKCLRPIAAGQVTTRQAMSVAIGLTVFALLGGLLIRPIFAAVIAGYFVLMIAYSYGVKRMVILDVFAIAAGFVLRAAGGAVAIDVPISPWLYVCTMLLALLIGFGKRRSELTSLEAGAGKHRANLESYTLGMLDQMITIVAAATVIAYSFYTFDASSVPGNHAMMLTIPFVVYAIFRYLYLVHRSDLGGSPELLLITDRPLLISIVLWAFASLLIVYLTM